MFNRFMYLQLHIIVFRQTGLRKQLNIQVSVATKVNPWAAGGLTHTGVLEQVAICLDRLQTDCVDLLYLHAPDHNTPIEETLGAVQEVYKGLCNPHVVANL